jgi:23S rRNA pseudouridine2457 synthase
LNFYCIIYKPFNVLSQFSPQDDKLTLKDFFDVPRDVYPVGRLDYDSEGLLILTNDKKLNHALLDPHHEHQREYWVQVDGSITSEAINQLKEGVQITVDGKPYHTKKCSASIFVPVPGVPERNPPVRFRKNIPTSWIKLKLAEGKNRQVRKMTAAVGFPTLRLLRHAIEGCNLDGLVAGETRILEQQEIYRLLFIK